MKAAPLNCLPPVRRTSSPSAVSTPSDGASRLQRAKDLLERLYEPLFYWTLLIAVWGVMFDLRIPA